MQGIYDLKPEAAKKLFLKILAGLYEDVEKNFEEQTDGYLTILEDLTVTLDTMSMDDFFGTEGWMHYFGIKD